MQIIIIESTRYFQIIIFNLILNMINDEDSNSTEEFQMDLIRGTSINEDGSQYKKTKRNSSLQTGGDDIE